MIGTFGIKTMRQEFPTDPAWDTTDDEEDEEDEELAPIEVMPVKMLTEIDTTGRDLAPYQALACAMSESDNWWLE